MRSWLRPYRRAVLNRIRVRGHSRSGELWHANGADSVAPLDHAFTLHGIERIHPQQAVVAIADQLPALCVAAIPDPPATTIAVAVDPPMPDIDIPIARLTPNRSGLRKVHPERPFLVVGQQRIAGQDLIMSSALSTVARVSDCAVTAYWTALKNRLASPKLTRNRRSRIRGLTLVFDQVDRLCGDLERQ